MTRSLSIRLKLLGLFAVIAFGISAYQTRHFYLIREGSAQFHTFCNINDAMNCNTVMSSRFAELAWGIPLSSLGASAFVALLILIAFAHLADARKDSLRGILLLTQISAAFSVIYFLIMVLAVKTLCVLCLSVDALVFAMLGLAWSFRKEGAGGKLKSTWIIAAASAITIPTLALVEAVPTPAQYSDEQLVNAWMGRPVIPVESGPEFNSIGPANAPVTIVEFSDMQCPHCRKGAYILNALKDRFPGKIRIVLRNYPMDSACHPDVPAGRGHNAACEAAQAIYCAAQQGQFEKAYQTIFDAQDDLAPGKTVDFLKGLNLDVNALKSCMGSESTRAAIQKDILEGKKHAVQSTPTFFANGHMVDGAYPLKAWVKLVEALLNEQNNP